MAQIFLTKRLHNRTFLSLFHNHPKRFFSSALLSSDDDDEDNNIPYLFLNKNDSLIKIRPDTVQEDLIVWNKFM